MTPTGLLQGKTAVITGGTTGIGRAIALAYVAQGCDVAVNHLDLPKDKAHLESLLAEAAAVKKRNPSAGRLAYLPGDVRDPSSGRQLIEFALREFGKDRLDVCVANAGICTFADILGEESEDEEGHEEEHEGTVKVSGHNGANMYSTGVNGNSHRVDGRLNWVNGYTNGHKNGSSHHRIAPLTLDLYTNTVRTNLDGTFYLLRAAARQMALKQHPPGGSIIGISSISALVGGGHQIHYTPTKAGVLSLMQSAAVALGRHGIRCNAILPGTVYTQLNEEDLRDEGKRAYMQGRIPLGRIGEPRDVAGPAVFLACEELSGYVTGAQVLVDGGLFVNLQ